MYNIARQHIEKGVFAASFGLGLVFFPWDNLMEASDSSTKHGYLLWQCHVSLIKKNPWETSVFVTCFVKSPAISKQGRAKQRVHFYKFVDIVFFYRSGLGIGIDLLWTKNHRTILYNNQCQWCSYMFPCFLFHWNSSHSTILGLYTYTLSELYSWGSCFDW